MAHKRSPARGQVQGAAVTQAARVAMLILNPTAWGLGIEPVSQCSQDAASPVGPQQKFQNLHFNKGDRKAFMSQRNTSLQWWDFRQSDRAGGQGQMSLKCWVIVHSAQSEVVPGIGLPLPVFGIGSCSPTELPGTRPGCHGKQDRRGSGAHVWCHHTCRWE